MRDNASALKEGISTKSFISSSDFASVSVPLDLPAEITKQANVANCVVKAFVEATPISGPASVVNVESAWRPMVLSGTFTIATTHTQARYKLPKVVEAFVKKYPKINLNIHQGDPSQVTEQILKGDADVGIATESIGQNDNILCIPCY